MNQTQASHTLNPGERAAQAQWNDPEVRALLFNLVTSYHKATKKFLMEDVDLEQLPAAIYHAPFVCLAHDQFQEGVVGAWMLGMTTGAGGVQGDDTGL